MNQQLRLRPLRILLLFSDTGGGHRSAAEALIETWQAEHPGAVAAEMVDVFRHYTPFPLNRAGPSYPWIVKYFSRAYASVFYSSDTPRRARTVARAAYAYVRPYFRRLLAEHPSDIIVSVHPLFNHCALGHARNRRSPALRHRRHRSVDGSCLLVLPRCDPCDCADRKSAERAASTAVCIRNRSLFAVCRWPASSRNGRARASIGQRCGKRSGFARGQGDSVGRRRRRHGAGVRDGARH